MLLGEGELRAIARGAAVLGAGGGGDPLIGLLMSLQAFEDFGPVELVDLDDLPGDGLLLPCGGMGAPTVSIEKIDNGSEGERLREMVEAAFGRPVVAVMASEIGGSNSLVPVAWAARMRLPVVDADGMGRAFPELPQVTMHVAGISPSPGFLTDERGNVLVTRAVSGEWLERIHRKVTMEAGGSAATAEYILTIEQARTATVRGSVSLAMRIGRTITHAQVDPVAALVEELRAFRLVTGKVVDVERRTTGGFVFGHALVEGLRGDVGRTVKLEIQNENLVALEGYRVLASVPDLITVLDSESANAIPTERLRYGQRATVIAFPCDPIWRTEGGLDLAGPRAFGYDFDYRPVEVLHARAS
ncbi:MAG: DUF917 domain-containing protein [Actinomycetota bacterium]